MTKQVKNLQKRLDNAAKASSMTLSAQLKALNHDAGYTLKSKDSEGKVTDYCITKREHLEQNLGLVPHKSKKGVCLGYTPATFNAAVDENLKEVGSDGKTKAYYAYVDRVVTVTMEDAATGTKDYSLYTSEEADKKVKGESAQSCKLYRKAIISECGWGPGLIIKVLRQSRQIQEEIKRAEESAKKFKEQVANGLYMVINKDGKLVKVEVNVQNANLF